MSTITPTADRVRHTFDEIAQACARDRERPMFPANCPRCSAETVSEDTADFYSGPLYGCQGQYTLKPQIQNHTDKWWGSCPIAREQAREQHGHPCGACGDKRLEGTGFPRKSFEWTCGGCGYRNPRDGEIRPDCPTHGDSMTLMEANKVDGEMIGLYICTHSDPGEIKSHYRTTAPYTVKR